MISNRDIGRLTPEQEMRAGAVAYIEGVTLKQLLSELQSEHRLAAILRYKFPLPHQVFQCVRRYV